uniref:Plastid light harvesting protein n=1 Tax=Chromera velia CCMP2878 TaxID=1169474 RepID=A0A0G4H2F4_9ALVE|mmetsp:Transcript_29321/g.57558  ORF Transcript_29321/g.57558 Transcript_29321/m.57558 type:complete len:215 (+) Transcript_29321:134-778(+)|eukprot:Cvel_24422.t1-p1 / transcript=Cvel_24422.t1 / gene=Cvel_24422 / organism=Chromera_velia_CCMP2878 / gene_product=Fucoxanthin-chlorophyll a-c binding protein B,, putative / transcript_product=Fucoxanthin-chlorophyll a-c binding protein B,, putative / location=Cvel_scaffold2637:1339-3978(-) / protein_length=214 / sequence_SO=supercontig / SO=protein_coding / is_pseudo=false
MKSLALLGAASVATALAGDSAAFVQTPRPVSLSRRSTPLSAYGPFIENDSGVTQTFPGFFDPLGLSAGMSADDDTYKYYKAAEIKHGRVAMLAVLGYIVPYFYKFDGWLQPDLKFSDIPAGGEALYKIGLIGDLQLFALAMFCEVLCKPNPQGTYEGDYIIPFWPNWYKGPKDPVEQKKYQTMEINNGRLAMIGIAALLVQDLVTDKGFPFIRR